MILLFSHRPNHHLPNVPLEQTQCYTGGIGWSTACSCSSESWPYPHCLVGYRFYHFYHRWSYHDVCCSCFGDLWLCTEDQRRKIHRWYHWSALLSCFSARSGFMRGHSGKQSSVFINLDLCGCPLHGFPHLRYPKIHVSLQIINRNIQILRIDCKHCG